MNAVRQLAHLLDRDRELRPGVPDRGGRPGSAGERQLLRLPQARGKCDQPLLGAVVEVPLDPPALGVGGADEPRARRDEAGGDGFPLGDRHREEQGREGGGGDEELDRERLARDRVAHERAELVSGLPDRDRHRDGDCERGAAAAEPERRPDQGREHQVGHGLLAAHGELAERDHGREREQRLDRRRTAQVPPGPPRPGEGERQDDECAAEVAEQPCPPDPRQLAGLDHASEAQRGGADDGADQRRGADADEESPDAVDRVEGRASLDEPPQQVRPGDDLEHVARGLPERGAGRQRAGEIGEQVADQDARPEA